MHAAIIGIKQLATPTLGNFLQTGQPILAHSFHAMVLLRATPAPASFIHYLAWHGLPDVPAGALESMSDAAALPGCFQALPAFGVRNMNELCKTLRVAALGTGNPMLNNK